MESRMCVTCGNRNTTQRSETGEPTCSTRCRELLTLFHMARLALQGSQRDVELFVHRLAYRYRNLPIGTRLAEIDNVPPVSLRNPNPQRGDA